MAQFKFQLDGVLRQRRLAEEQRQRELAVTRGEMTALEAELRAMDASMNESTAGVRENLVGRVDLSYLAAHRRFTVSMQRKAIILAQQMAAVQVRIDAAQRALAEAAMQRKVIEKLRERREAEWRADLSRREMADLDEVATRIGYRNAVAAAAAEASAADQTSARE